MTRILLAEDNDMNRDFLSRALEREGFDVVTACDGNEALERSRDHPALILMDLGLPEVDGWEVTRRLKADERTRGIPVIAITAHAMSDDRDRALEAGCDAYETKPIDLPALLGTIRQLLPPTENNETG